MDCDGTHNPKNIKTMFGYIKKYNIVMTTMLKKNSLKGWPLIRIIITKMRYYLFSLILGTKLDSSDGFLIV